MDKVKTLIVDDSARFASAMQEYLSSKDWIRLVASASSGEEALQRFDADTPDLVITDLQMPNLNGFDLARELKRRQPSCRVVVLSVASLPGHAALALAAGADAFLSKARVTVELVPLIAHLFDAHPGILAASAGQCI